MSLGKFLSLVGRVGSSQVSKIWIIGHNWSLNWTNYPLNSFPPSGCALYHVDLIQVYFRTGAATRTTQNQEWTKLPCHVLLKVSSDSMHIIAKTGRDLNVHRLMMRLTKGSSHTEEHSSTIKRSDLLIHETTWMNLNNMMLSERSQTQKTTYCMIPFMWNS